MEIGMPKARVLNSREQGERTRDIIAASLEDDKAENIKAIDLAGKADFAMFMVVATGRSSKHVTSMADKVVDKLLENGIRNINIEGKEKGDWVLIDAHDVIVNIFRQEVRDIYQIEKIWGF